MARGNYSNFEEKYVTHIDMFSRILKIKRYRGGGGGGGGGETKKPITFRDMSIARKTTHNFYKESCKKRGKEIKKTHK